MGAREPESQSGLTARQYAVVRFYMRTDEGKPVQDAGAQTLIHLVTATAASHRSDGGRLISCMLSV